MIDWIIIEENVTAADAMRMLGHERNGSDLRMGLVMLAFRKDPGKLNAWAYLVMAIVFAGNAYVLWGWAAYIAHLSYSWSAAPEVTQHSLYFVIGFFGWVGPLASMAAGETNIGTAIHFFLTSIAL